LSVFLSFWLYSRVDRDSDVKKFLHCMNRLTFCCCRKCFTLSRCTIVVLGPPETFYSRIIFVLGWGISTGVRSLRAIGRTSIKVECTRPTWWKYWQFRKRKKVLRTMTVKFIDSKIKCHFYGSHEAYYIILFLVQYQYLCNFPFIFFSK